MKIDDILRVLKNNQIQPFEVIAGLDINHDVILKDCNMDEFIRFCNSAGKKIAFYEVSFVELDDYVVDEDKLRENIEEIVNDKLKSCHFDDEVDLTTDDFKDEIEQKLREIRKHNVEVTKTITDLCESEVLFASVYVICDGTQIGVLLENEYMEDYQMAFEIEEELRDSITELIAPKISLYEMDEISCYERLKRNMEERRNQEKEKRQKAKLEIRELIEEDASLLECTNQKLRHAYAKRIVEEYYEKFDVAITIGDVEFMADEVYKKSKKTL